MGAGTRDTGLSFTRFTFQFTHATADDTNAERAFILDELEGGRRHRRDGLASGGRSASPLGKVNHYVADGEIAVARLA